jgi:hypothetical protein
MSFEILLTRTLVPGIGRRLEEPGAQPLSLADFELIMNGAPLRRRLEDGTCWLWHPEGMAWLSASFHPGNDEVDGYVSFALSYAHNQFLKVWADAFELALRLARHIGARVFEDVSFKEITRENAGELLDPASTFVEGQARFWKETVTGLEERLQAPLEYPIGRYDAVNDYFIFFLDPKKKVDLPSLISGLNLSCAPDSIGTDRFALQDPGSGNLLARVLLRPDDGALQIRPFYWMEPFSTVAEVTLDLAYALQHALGGQLFLRDKPLSPEFRAEIVENIKGLGVEFFLYLEARK